MVQGGLEGGDNTGRYEILRVVNRGGMGEIALARVKGSKGFEKLVVLKRLRADAERDDHREMFDVEAELMSRIEHPNIVQVFDQPKINGVQYLAMAYVRGRNLDQMIRRTRQSSLRISPAFTLTIMGEVLRGLAFVHRLKDDAGRGLGVVHQDITPSNILVSFFGEVKITDFGIAYVTSRDGGRRTGVLKGKPRYVSPEVLAGRRVNNRADIYGVGVVLYELLAGRALFARPTLEETLAGVARNELPDFKVVFPNLGEGIHKLMARALAKDPQDRYRTAEEMHADLAAELAVLGGPISPARVGYLLRQWFGGDPDVPEVDPTFDAALAEETARPGPQTYRSPNLDQTITELDRLLGGETSSADLFQLPPEIQRELEGIEDAEPFAALTPIPDLALSGPNGEELLLRGSMEGIDLLPGTPPLQRSTNDDALAFEPLPFQTRPPRAEAPRHDAPRATPVGGPKPSANPSRTDQAKLELQLPPFPGAGPAPSNPPPAAAPWSQKGPPGPGQPTPAQGHRIPGSTPSKTPLPLSSNIGPGTAAAGNEDEDSALVRTVSNRGRRAALGASPGEYTYAPARKNEEHEWRAKTPHDMPAIPPSLSASSSELRRAGSTGLNPPLPHPPLPGAPSTGAAAQRPSPVPPAYNPPHAPAQAAPYSPPHAPHAPLPPTPVQGTPAVSISPLAYNDRPPLQAPPSPSGAVHAPASTSPLSVPILPGTPAGAPPAPRGTMPIGSLLPPPSSLPEAPEAEDRPSPFWVGMLVGLLIGAAIVSIVFWQKLFGAS